MNKASTKLNSPNSPVKKYERLFSEHYEHGIAQFRNLGEDEHGRPESRHAVRQDVAGEEEEEEEDA
jgi:hypothetical protein